MAQLQGRVLSLTEAAKELAQHLRRNGVGRATVWTGKGVRVYVDDETAPAGADDDADARRGYLEVVAGVGWSAVRDRTPNRVSDRCPRETVFTPAWCVVDDEYDEPTDAARRTRSTRAEPAAGPYSAAAQRLLRPARARRTAGAVAGAEARDAAVDVVTGSLLTSDPEGVSRAEACARAAAERLVAWGAPAATRVRWQTSPRYRFARGTCPEHAMVARSALVRAVQAAGEGARWWPAEPTLATLVEGDLLWRRASAAGLLVLPADGRPRQRELAATERRAPRELAGRTFADLANPFTPLLEVAALGYLLCAVDANGIELLVPPRGADR